ncbi:MAG TPA: hypothetical protein VFW38_02195 [Solirubrobacteraceae bacterium]|nr:hypothetical protein [Solirubrobacteraceae bacterium]
MIATAIAILASITAAEVLTLVLPLAVLIAAVAWYTWLWMHGAGER